ncbi:MAG: hypothetical protein C0402_01545 [Thermodesulfovibrio sp.]|nr:hypothetical protein [Thermodesulfovibrio sp.]
MQVTVHFLHHSFTTMALINAAHDARKNIQERDKGMTVEELVERLGKVGDLEGLTALYDQYDIHPLTIEPGVERDLLQTFLERNNVSRDQWHLDDNILWIRVS